MRSDHLSDGVCVDQTSEEDEGNEMIVQNFWVEPEVCWNQSPGHEEGHEAEESAAGFVASSSADFDDIQGPVSLALGCH